MIAWYSIYEKFRTRLGERKDYMATVRRAEDRGIENGSLLQTMKTKSSYLDLVMEMVTVYRGD